MFCGAFVFLFRLLAFSRCSVVSTARDYIDRNSPAFWLIHSVQVDYKFMVHHYAGEIVYATEGFLEKNRDMLHQEGIDLLQSSTSQFIRSFGDR